MIQIDVTTAFMLVFLACMVILLACLLFWFIKPSPQKPIPVPFGAWSVADKFLTADPSVQEADARKVLNQLAPYTYAPYATPDTIFRAINLCNTLISKSYDKK